MQRPIHRMIFIICMMLIPTLPASAVEVTVSINMRETYVNQPIALSIAIDNATSFDKPSLPPIENAVISPEPSISRSTTMQTINGRTSTRETTTLTYYIVPQQPGTLTIPSLTVVADGRTFTSEPIEILVHKSETGDLMFAEIVADRESIYLGEPLQITLQLWIKQFQAPNLRSAFTAQHMWERIDVNGSDWGAFAEGLGVNPGTQRTAEITAAAVTRTNDQGNDVAYHLYQITAIIWPQRAGRLELEAPTILVNYPLRLSRDSVFGPRTEQWRPITVTPEAPIVDIRTPPTDGQPATFNGAVGQFDIAVGARPTEVSVGDPITLTITITDKGNPATAAQRLNLLRAPPLDRIPELAENFRIPSDSLAGTVRGTTKTFTQTVRAKSADVTRIPPIPISFFDPATETYSTRESQPIALTVQAVDSVDTSEIVQAATPQTNGTATQLRAVEGGLVANFVETDLLLASHDFQWSWWSMLALAAPPALFVAVTAGRFASSLRHRNGSGSRKKQARSRALSRLREAASGDGRSQAQVVFAAIADYVADRLDLPAGTLASDEIVHHLRRCNINAADIADVQQLLNECEHAAYAGGLAASAGDDLAHRASDCIARLDRSRWA